MSWAAVRCGRGQLRLNAGLGDRGRKLKRARGGRGGGVNCAWAVEEP